MAPFIFLGDPAFKQAPQWAIAQKGDV